MIDDTTINGLQWKDNPMPGRTLNPNVADESHTDHGVRRALRSLVKALPHFLASIAIAGVLVAITASIVAYAGCYDVSVKSGHSKVVAGALNTVMVRSVRAHARDIRAPAAFDLPDAKVLDKGAAHYEQMCRQCHGAPGKDAAPWELYPPAPDLVDAIRENEWTDPEVFWIVKYGIKDTAMPAFGSAHDDQDTWAMTAFVRHLPKVTPEQYKAMSERGLARGKAMGEHGYHTEGSKPEQKPESARPSEPQKHEPREHEH